MSQKFQSLSHDEHSQLLVFMAFLASIIVLFLGTAFLLVRAFPQYAASLKIGRNSISPDLGIFLSLTFICVVFLLSALRAVLFNRLALSYSPLVMISLFGSAGFFFFVYESFALLGFTHGIMVLGIVSLEFAIIAIGGIRLIDWLDSLYSDFPFSIKKGLLSPDASPLIPEDSLFNELISKQK